MIKIPNLKLIIKLEYQNTKRFSLKYILQIGMKKFLRLKKLKILLHGHMLLIILVEHFMKKNCKKQISNDLG